MNKIGRYFKCPKTGAKPGPECATCSYRIIRRPKTEPRIFSVDTPFCTHKEAM